MQIAISLVRLQLVAMIRVMLISMKTIMLLRTGPSHWGCKKTQLYAGAMGRQARKPSLTSF